MSQYKIVGMAVLLSILVTGFVAAQNEAQDAQIEQINITRTLGDQYLNISMGINFPLFFYSPSTGETVSTGLTYGGIGTLGWGAFLNNNLSVGIDVDGLFATDPNGASVFMIPFGVNTTYFLRVYPFEVPLKLGLAANIIRYKDISELGVLVKAGTGIYWDAFQDWSFGMNFTYYWIPEVYTGTSSSNPPASHTRFGNFMEITVSALYNFH